MEIWLIFALLSLLVVAALFAGSRMLSGRPGTDSAAAQTVIYKDQLAEIDADLARGVLAPAEAEAHRTEVSRRLLAVAASGAAASEGRRWFVPVLALMIPALAFAVYTRVGAPSFPDLPQAERLANAEGANDLEAMIYKVERHLQKHPDDANGWEVVMPSYKAMGRFDDAANAMRRLIELQGATADRYADLAEMMLFAGNGLMPPLGAAAAQEAVKLDAKNSKGRYYTALSQAQDGQTSLALAGFEALLADSPADAPWRPAVEKQIADIKSGGGKAAPPGPTQEQVNAAGNMAPDDQQAMIRGMVDNLAAKLEADPNNIDGWLRLIRARVVLKEVAVAQTALDKARTVFDGNQGALDQLAAIAQELGLK
jgi:cytochrome c-type biogenesis protein CcmH